MLPSFSSTYARDSRAIHTIGNSDSDMVACVQPYRSHLDFCQLGLSASLSNRRASLSHAVMAVVGLSTEKQVGRVDAEALIASVENKHSVQDWTPTKNPRDSMRSDMVTVLIYPEHAVSTTSATPPPARLRTTASVDLGPEPIRYRLSGSHLTSLGSVVRDRLRVHSPSGPANHSTGAHDA